jgi:hypothetical protein
MITDSNKSANMSRIIPIMKVARCSAMHVFDVAAESALYYLHHEGAQFIANDPHDENRRVLQVSWMWIVKFRMCLAIHCSHL